MNLFTVRYDELRLRIYDKQFMIEQITELKNSWMASHITDAEFPTPLSVKGLNLYQSRLEQLSTQLLSTIPSNSDSELTYYRVDCHPLTIRFSMVLASQWEDESEREAVFEYLTQIMFEDNSPAHLYVGFHKGKPAACGMIFRQETEQGLCTLVSDVMALPLSNKANLMQMMENHLLALADQDSQFFATQK